MFGWRPCYICNYKLKHNILHIYVYLHIYTMHLYHISPSFSVGTEGPFLGDEGSGASNRTCTRSSDEVKNSWRYISTSQHASMALCLDKNWDKFTLPLY
jgi:hypothetical protein